jgi:ferritin-like metal-binding protein YciE
MQLSTWDKEELDEKLANRVQVSKRAVAKIVQVFDRMMQRNEKITVAMKGVSENGGRWICVIYCGKPINFFFVTFLCRSHCAQH